MKKLFLFAVLLFSIHSQARISQSFTYSQLLQKSDLVAIATPVENTKDTKELFELPGLGIKVIGVESKLRIAAILKGSLSKNEVILHHYRLPDPNKPQFNGPMLASFNVRDVNKRHSLLIFLIKESDGRYAPTGGQTDPFRMSISELSVDTDSELINMLNKQGH